MITTRGAARPERARQFFHAFYRWQITLAGDSKTLSIVLQKEEDD